MPDCEHYVYVVKLTRPEMMSEGPTPAETARIDEHFNYVKDLHERGVVELAGRTLNDDETRFGIVIMRIGSESEARRIMDNDPAVKHGVMSATLHPFAVRLPADKT